MRRGFTIVEVMISMAIMGMVMVAVGVLTQAVYQTNEHTQTVGLGTQHARVAMQRISQTVSSAYAVNDEPGMAVIETIAGGEYLPETVVIWAPSGDPLNPLGPPIVSELVFYTPNPNDPLELWELTAPGDSQTQSLKTINSSAGRALLSSLKASGTTIKRTVMSRMQGVTFASAQRPLLRFSVSMRPSASEWTQTVAGTLAWEDMNWPQSMFSADWGMRSVCLQMEAWMSIVPNSQPGVSVQEHSIPFFRAATFNYRLQKP